MNDQTRILAEVARDPLKFIKACWPKMDIYPKQLEVLLSVCDTPETFVHAANKTGKTRIAACFPRAVKWLFHAAGNPVDEDSVDVLNMREQSADEILAALLHEEPV